MKNSRSRAVLLALALATTVLGAGPAPSSPRPAVPFIADDYASALAQARAKKLPIFVEAWAPW